VSKVAGLTGSLILLIAASLVPSATHGGQISLLRSQRVAVIAPLDCSESPRLVVGFDLSVLEDDRRIDFAQLLFEGYLDRVDSAAEVARIEALPVTTEWEPAGVSWEAPWDSTGGDFDSSRRKSNWVVVGDSTAMWLDVTKIVKDWNDATIPNHGIIVKISDSEDATLDQINSGSVVLKVWHHADRNR
jgi:hypothetical protein